MLLFLRLALNRAPVYDCPLLPVSWVIEGPNSNLFLSNLGHIFQITGAQTRTTRCPFVAILEACCVDIRSGATA